MKKILASVACLALLAGCSKVGPASPSSSGSTLSGSDMSAANSGSGSVTATGSGEVFGADVTYQPTSLAISKDLAADFSTDEAKNLADIETAYGLKLSAADKTFLSKNKFLIKNLLETNIRPVEESADNYREFLGLYNAIRGSDDYKERKPENALFWSSDIFFHSFNNLYTELLKELENKDFYPAMKDLSHTFYQSAAAHLAAATTDADKKTWTEVRNYFAVADAIFQNAVAPLTQQDYVNLGEGDPAKLKADHDATDKTIDTEDSVAAYVKNLHLDPTSETAVLADLKQIYAASQNGVPTILKSEYDDYTAQTQIQFKIPFSMFTPRGTYTSSSLRRQYFRGMNWYIQTPLFLKSPQLTTDAFAMSQLMAEHPKQLQDYDTLEANINFLVGTSDDLMPVDYLKALAAGKGQSDPSTAAMTYLVNARNPKIKSLTAQYPSVGDVKTSDVLLLTKGMHFFSGKFIIDSYWTGNLTQGDEAPKPGYPMKLPPMASSLEVMGLLGSDYAASQIPKLDFYNPAVDKAMSDLAAEKATFGDDYWTSNIYNGWLWTIQSLFGWQKTNKSLLPAFMQSPMWEVKTLQTASAFWTELRHATILYAKQSFAEKGGGGPDTCDHRKVPDPPKAYIEPQLEAYDKLEYIAKRLDSGLKQQNLQLDNLSRLESFMTLMDTVQSYVKKELQDQTLAETVISKNRPDPSDATKTCTEYFIDGPSDWETLRLQIVQGLNQALPTPVEGPVLPAKDRRAALVADVHTGGDSQHDAQILYEGTGVPQVILTAVKDVSGPRITVGFTYSHYEFRKDAMGPRMTDEEWQKNFYTGDDSAAAYQYTDPKTWPAQPVWYDSILKLK